MAIRSNGGSSVHAVDLFCGAGGLAYGLARAGLSVAAGIDLDPACKFPFEANNKAKFHLADVAKLDATQVQAMFPKKGTRVLVGCAPCQPFSRYARSAKVIKDIKWGLHPHFRNLVKQVRPDLVTMENVPELARHEVFADFVAGLRSLGYSVRS